MVLRQKGSDGINEAIVDCEETTCALVMVTLFIPTVDRRRAYTNAKAISDIKKVQPNCSPTRNLRSKDIVVPM